VVLRRLHAEIDAAVLASYGWADLDPTCDFFLDYEDEENGEEGGRKRKKPWRLRWPDGFRDKVLGRLLELNMNRSKAEAEPDEGSSEGLATKGLKRAKANQNETELF